MWQVFANAFLEFCNFALMDVSICSMEQETHVASSRQCI